MPGTRLILSPAHTPRAGWRLSPRFAVRRKTSILAAVCLLTACATTQAPPPAAGGPAWGPLAPQTLGATRSANQRVRVAYADKEAALDCVLNITPAEITIVGLLPAGPRVFT